MRCSSPSLVAASSSNCLGKLSFEAAPARADDAPKDTVREEVGKPLQAAQALMKDKKYKEALAKIKDVEVLRPHKELFDRLRTDRDGLVAYNAGLIADKLEALSGTHMAGQEGKHEDE